MRKLVVFQQISLDGYFTDSHGDMSWAKNDNDEEFNAFSSENAKGGASFSSAGSLTISWRVSGLRHKHIKCCLSWRNG